MPRYYPMSLILPRLVASCQSLDDDEWLRKAVPGLGRRYRSYWVQQNSVIVQLWPGSVLRLPPGPLSEKGTILFGSLDAKESKESARSASFLE
jgi:hypothetical protein